MPAFNVFDQFDDPKAPIAAPVAAAPAGPNAFDQFDSKTAAPAAPAGAEPSFRDKAMSVLHALVSGVNSGAADLVGLPMAAATAATNTVKGPLDYAKDKLGIEHGGAIDPATVPGTPEWIKAKVEGLVPGSMVDSNHPIIHGIAEAVGPGGGAALAAHAAEMLPEIAGAAAPSDAAPLASARGAGFKTTASNIALRNPTQQPGLGNQIAEFASGGNGTVTRSNQAANTANATDLAGQQLGMEAGTTKINPPDLKAAKVAPAATYDQTGVKLGSFQPSGNLMNLLNDAQADQSVQAAPASRTAAKRILQSIAENKGLYNGTDATGDISTLRESAATRPIANMLEDEIGRQLSAGNDPKALQQYQDARKQFAQIYAVQDALKGGQVDPQALLAADPKLQFLTGNLRQIASAANELPADVRLPEAATGDALDALLKGTKGILGYPIRKVVTSQPFQNQFGRQADATGQSYFKTFGERPAPGQAPLTLTAPEGSVGAPTPVQGELAVPQNPRPLIDLKRPDGSVGSTTPVQGEMTVPPARETLENITPPPGQAFEPNQPDLFPPNNVRVPKPAPKMKLPKSIKPEDMELLNSLGLGDK